MNQQPTLWGGMGGKTGNEHPETSYNAGRTVRSGTQKHQILQVMYGHPDGVTAYELRGKIRNGAGDPISTNQIATRLLELREDRMVIFVRDAITGLVSTRPTTPGNEGQIQRLNEWGLQNATST